MSIRVYPVQKTDITCNDYEVYVNGTRIDTNTARVSAMPFNRRWPGHQRSKDQTELIQFVSMFSDEPLRFEIIPSTPVTKAVIRPHSLCVEPKIASDGKICFTVDKSSYFVVEPYGRNKALHFFIDSQDLTIPDNCDKDIIYYGPGIHEVGQIKLKSNQTLYIDEGAVVYACITAIDADNIKILGHGILDNSHNKEQILYEANVDNNWCAVNNAVRRHTIQLEYCNNVEIDGITIRDSLVYNIRPLACKNLNIRNVKIIGCWRYNSDGIDMHNCERVVIEHCFVRTYDDSICVKGFDCYYEGDVEEAVQKAMYRNGKAYDVFKDVLVRDCVIWNDWGKCFEIGAETRAKEIFDITFADSDVIHVTGDVLDCFNVDYADVHDVTYRNIRVEMDERILQPIIQNSDSETYHADDPDFAPAVIAAIVAFNKEYSAGGTKRGKNHLLTFENIEVFGVKKPKVYFCGYNQEAESFDIVVKNVVADGVKLCSKDSFDWIEDHFTHNCEYREG